MRKLLFAAAAAGAVFAAAPAFAQVDAGVGPGGAGVQVGPVGVGVGPGYEGRHYYRHHDEYYGGCRMVRERIETPSGRVIYKSRRTCD